MRHTGLVHWVWCPYDGQRRLDGSRRMERVLLSDAMTKTTIRVLRFSTVIVAAGTLFQTTGCLTADTTGGILTALVGAILQNLVAGSFNLV